MTGVVRLGVIGCGLIAQARHMQFFRELNGLSLEAVCDISPGTAEAVGDRFGVKKRYYQHQELLADPDIDAVAVFTYDHAPVVLDAIAAGKHVFVEKPLAFTPAEARQIQEAADKAGVLVMVGYMKVYDPAFEWAAGRIKAQGRPRSIYLHDYAGNFEQLRRKDVLPIRVDDVPEAVAARRQKWTPEVVARVAEALGPDHAGYAELYVVLLMLGCHDLAVLCEIFGPPAAVRYAQQLDETTLLAVLEYADGVPCTFEVGVGAKYEWWDEHLTVYGQTDEVRLEFGNPFVPFSPTVVRVREGEPEVRSEATIGVAYDDAFRREWVHFIECVTTGRAPRTPISAGARDIDLCIDIIRAMPPRRRDEQPDHS